MRQLRQSELDDFEPLLDTLIEDLYTPIVAGGNGLIGAIRLRRSSNYAHSGSGDEVIPMVAPGSVSESFQHDLAAWDSGNPSRITNTSEDTWVAFVHAQIEFDNDGATGARRPKLLKNGVTEIAQFREDVTASVRSLEAGTLITLAPDDYVQLVAQSNTSVTIISSARSPVLSLSVLGIL